MIAFLKGTLAGKTATTAYIEVNGVGYAVGMSQASLSKLPEAGAPVEVHTFLQVRDDALALYGFLALEEKALFERLIGVGGVVMALSKSTSMSWIIAVCVLILVGFIAVIYSIVMPKFKLVQKLVDRLNLVVREHLSGMMVIRAFGTQSYEEDRFEVANRNLTRNYRFVNRVTAFMMPAMMFLMNVMSLVIVWIGGHQIEQATMQVGDMLSLIHI